MKTLSLLALLALSTTACVGAQDTTGLDDETMNEADERVGETHDPLTVFTTMGNVGWANQTPNSTDLVLAHQIGAIQNKMAEVTSAVSFDGIVGLEATTSNVEDCESSSLDVYVYKRGFDPASWTMIDHRKAFAKAVVKEGTISTCQAWSEPDYCAPYKFSGSDAVMEVDVIAVSPGGRKGKKFDLVRYPIVNIANCN